MGTALKKGSISKYTQVNASIKKSKESNVLQAEVWGVSPMMPRDYSARERQEIRKKELQILKGITN